jgi:hypothetical protein
MRRPDRTRGQCEASLFSYTLDKCRERKFLKCILTSFSNPDLLATGNALGLTKAGIKVLAGLVDRVGTGGLEVGKRVVTEPDDLISLHAMIAVQAGLTS